MKKIVIDGKCLNSKRISGIERVYIEVLKRLDHLVEPGQVEILVPNTYDNLPVYQNIKIVKYGKPIKGLWRQLILPYYIWKHRAIGFHMNNTAPIIKPDVVCLYDINNIANPQFFAKSKIDTIFHSRYRIKAAICKNAKKIIVSSDFTKSELKKYFSCDLEKIETVYLGWQHYLNISDTDCLEKYGLKKNNYFFAMSNLAPTKNFKWVLDEAKKHPEEKFVIAGACKPEIFGDTYSPERLKAIKYLGYISDGEAKALMKNSKAFLYPSLYEGFGIPPLEALSTGTTVILSDIPCLKEVFGEYVYYIDPHITDYDLGRIIDNNQIKDPYELLQKYSWDKTASEMWGIVKKIAE